MAAYEPYMKDQAAILFKHWPAQAEWFIVGGPADGNEAQTVKARYPRVRCIGFEPQPYFVLCQRYKLRFPGFVLPYALWHYPGVLELHEPGIKELEHMRSSSLCRPPSSPDLGIWEVKKSTTVVTEMLDNLSTDFGPFANAVLWLDIEYAELEALRGARGLLKAGQILLINLETFAHLQPAIDDYLAQFGLRELFRWNQADMPGGQRADVVYAKG